MIPRYSRPEMTAIWEPQTRFRIWFEIEAHAADAMAEAGIVPKAAAKKIWAMGKDAIFDVARIDAIEEVTVSTTGLGADAGGQGAMNIRLTTNWRYRWPACRPEAPGAGAQELDLHRAQPRHSCGAHDIRGEACLFLCRIHALPGAAGCGKAGSFNLRAFRFRWHLSILFFHSA